jgi:FkbH-like protein
MACLGCDTNAHRGRAPVTFLEAHRLLRSFTGGRSLPIRVVLSGNGEPLALYLKASGARHGVAVEPVFLPFNTLDQHLLTEPDGTLELFVLLPWDFAPEFDWRSGIPLTVDEAALLERAYATEERLRRRGACIAYLPAPVPPVLSDPERMRELPVTLRGIAIGLGASEISNDAFSLSSHFTSGCPIAGASLGSVAMSLMNLVLQRETERQAPREAAKVLVSDLDNVAWYGLVAEDGLQGIECGPQTRGYPHFVYQTLLARLKNEGVLLAAVSRNDFDVAVAPFRSGQTVLKEDDLVAIIATYNAKSAQIASLAEHLDLGLDSFVFVDDNELELAEVRLQLPTVRCEQFPSRTDDLPASLERISRHFGRTVVTAEDRERTVLYRRRLAGMITSTAEGADLRSFLKDLDMTLSIHDRSVGDRTRAVQLINKTNQFNINGKRLSDKEVADTLSAGGRLLTATLTDRNGTHGEILAILLDASNVVRAFVLSCRVFNRRVEFAFLLSLTGTPRSPRMFDTAETPRNEPARRFLADPAFRDQGHGRLLFDGATFVERHAGDLSLFRLLEPGVSTATRISDGDDA